MIPRLSENLAEANFALVAIVFGAAIAATLAIGWILGAALEGLLHGGGEGRLAATAERVRRAVRRTAAALASAFFLCGCALAAASIWLQLDLVALADEILAGVRLAELRRQLVGSIALVAAVLILRRLLRPVIAGALPRLSRLDLFRGQEAPLSRLVLLLDPVLVLGLILGAARFAPLLAGWPESSAAWLGTGVYIVLVVAATRAVALAGGIAVDALANAAPAEAEAGRIGRYLSALAVLRPLARRSIEAVVAIAGARLAVAEFESLQWFSRWGAIVIGIITIVFIARVVVEFGRVVIFDAMGGDPSPVGEAGRRRLTLVRMVQNVVAAVIYFGAGLYGLETLGINPTPVLAGAGIVGLTVGLGAQKIVGDVISGFFMLFEGQVLVGDYVRIGEAEGTVEQLFLRVTLVRDSYGRLHTLRNGEIAGVINYSRGFTLAIAEMRVPFDADLDLAIGAVERAGKALVERLPDLVLGPPTVAGIDAIAESALIVRAEIKVQPGRHFEVKRAFHRCLVEEFRRAGLTIPYPTAVQLATAAG